MKTIYLIKPYGKQFMRLHVFLGNGGHTTKSTKINLPWTHNSKVDHAYKKTGCGYNFRHWVQKLDFI